MNEKPYEHASSNGTRFFADRCDFRNGVDVQLPASGLSQAQLAQDVAEMTSQHCLCIWPELNGFNGYDTLDFRMHESTDSP